MKRLKTSLCIFLTLCFLLIFSACSSEKNSNETNEDNTQQTDYSINDTSAFSAQTTLAENTTAQSGTTDAESLITRADIFSNGVAWVIPNIKYNYHRCLIDKTGKVIKGASDKVATEMVCPIDNNLGSITLYDSSAINAADAIVEASLIDASGSVVASSLNGDFDLIIDCAEGKALVYKNASDITTSKHMYGVIDSNGNWVYPLTDWGVAPVDVATSESPSPIYGFYAGEGMYAVSIENGMYTDNFIIFNSNTKTSFFLYNVRQKMIHKDRFKFTNGFAVVIESDRMDPSYMTSTYCTEHINTNSSDIPDYVTVLPNSFLCYADGTIKEFDFDDINMYISDNVKIVDDNKTYTIYPDLATSSSYTISKYSTSNGVTFEFYGELGLMKIKGLDGKQYFTLIDRTTGTERFEPISYTSVDFGDGKIVYKDTNVSNSFKVLDTNGTLLIDNLQYEEVNPFNDGMAVVKIADKQYGYIDTNGNLVISKLVLA